VFLDFSANFASTIWQAFVTAFAKASATESNSIARNCCHDSSKTPSEDTEKLAVNRLLHPRCSGSNRAQSDGGTTSVHRAMTVHPR